MKRNLQFTVLAALLSICAASAPARAGGEFSIRGLFGTVDRDPSDFTLYDFLFRGAVEVTPRLNLFGEFALAHTRSDGFDGTGLSNLSLGADFWLRARASYQNWLSFSLSLPTGKDDGDGGVATGLSSLFWIPDRGLFAPDTTTVRIHSNFRFGQVRRHIQIKLGGEFLAVDGAEDIFRVLVVARGRFDLSRRVGLFAAVGNALNVAENDVVEDFEHFAQLGLELAPQGRGLFDFSFYLPLGSAADGFAFVLGFTSGF